MEQPTPPQEEPISQASSHSEEPMDQDSEEQSTPTEEKSEPILAKDIKSGPSRIRRSKPKVNLIQRNKAPPPQRKPKVANQSKNLTTQITEEPPPPLKPLSKKTVTPTITRPMLPPAPSNNPKPSFFENSEISPHRKKEDTIDLTDPDDLPLVVLKQKAVETKTAKRKKPAVQSNTITKYLSPPENKTKKAKNSYDSEEELPGFEFDKNKASSLPVNYVIIESQPMESDTSLEVAQTFENENFVPIEPIPNLRRTEPTPPPLGNIRAYPKKAPRPPPKKPRKKLCEKTTSTPVPRDREVFSATEPPPPSTTPESGKQLGRINKAIHPYLLLVTNRAELANQPDEFQPVEVIDCKPGSVQCGFCGVVTYSKDWMAHLETHYGVGWKVGEPVEVSI